MVDKNNVARRVGVYYQLALFTDQEGDTVVLASRGVLLGILGGGVPPSQRSNE